MKVKYLSMLAIASVMSLGFVGACANPCAATDEPDAGTTTETVDPCAGEDPCAASEDPCAGAEDPCAAGEDPCAGN